ncbi:hypothetical protein [Akkermansia muciniphila]|uniref:hypothetical protein n=1 Tax=Akkermansia muciniphila TaxID=239935 RepID=UPI000FE3F150|nr:hypothetical protein [Akkermansia muciniphila]UBU78485.1 hypothetical protein LDO78_09285 [Akkermansia muciniphila]
MPNFIASLKTFFMHTESLPKYPPVQKPPPAFETAQDKSENRRTLFPESWYICRECPFQQPQETVRTLQKEKLMHCFQGISD